MSRQTLSCPIENMRQLYFLEGLATVATHNKQLSLNHKKADCCQNHEAEAEIKRGKLLANVQCESPLIWCCFIANTMDYMRAKRKLPTGRLPAYLQRAAAAATSPTRWGWKTGGASASRCRGGRGRPPGHGTPRTSGPPGVGGSWSLTPSPCSGAPWSGRSPRGAGSLLEGCRQTHLFRRLLHASASPKDYVFGA